MAIALALLRPKPVLKLLLLSQLGPSAKIASGPSESPSRLKSFTFLGMASFCQIVFARADESFR
ncbi:MAG TPA: hypothetical protein VKX28_16760 [Xanthobacteraceae bacterium]|nr:hypothetical protein [Xanthobacteraceae bacterium]